MELPTGKRAIAQLLLKLAQGTWPVEVGVRGRGDDYVYGLSRVLIAMNTQEVDSETPLQEALGSLLPHATEDPVPLARLLSALAVGAMDTAATVDFRKLLQPIFRDADKYQSIRGPNGPILVKACTVLIAAAVDDDTLPLLLSLPLGDWKGGVVALAVRQFRTGQVVSLLEQYHELMDDAVLATTLRFFLAADSSGTRAEELRWRIENSSADRVVDTARQILEELGYGCTQD